MNFKNRLSFLINWSKKIVLPGFKGMNLFEVASFYFEGIEKGAITTRASSIAFNFFLAFFPALIFLFTLIPYISIDGLQETLLEIIAVILPPSTNEITFQSIADIINNPRGGLLSVGFILALFFSTNGVNSLIEAFNASIHIRENRPIIQQRILSLSLTLLLSLILIVAMALIIFSKITISYLTSFENLDLFHQLKLDFRLHI